MKSIWSLMKRSHAFDQDTAWIMLSLHFYLWKYQKMLFYHAVWYNIKCQSIVNYNQWYFVLQTLRCFEEKRTIPLRMSIWNSIYDRQLSAVNCCLLTVSCHLFNDYFYHFTVYYYPYSCVLCRRFKALLKGSGDIPQM